MKIEVQDAAGGVMYLSDTKSMHGVAPGIAERDLVSAALIKAGRDLAAGRLPPMPGDGPIVD